MTKCFINIETRPPVGTKPGPQYVKVPGSVTKAETRAKYEADEELQREGWMKLAVSKLEAQVHVITILAEGEDAPRIFAGDDELELFEQLHVAIRQHQMEAASTGVSDRIEWVTYNGHDFDFPILYTRALKHRLRDLAGQFKMSSRWGDDRHVDIFRQLGGEGKLDDWAEFFQINNPNTINGDELLGCLESGQIQTATDHITSRVTVLREITRLMGV